MEKHKVLLLIAYLLFFIVLSGKATMEVLIIGLIISFIMVYRNISNENSNSVKWSFSLRKMFIYILFVALLVKEIIIANINVALILIKPKMLIAPYIVKHKTKLKRSYNRVVLANTISLTPGTLTIDINEDVLTIHCLSQSFTTGIYNSKLENLLIKLEE